MQTARWVYQNQAKEKCEMPLREKLVDAGKECVYFCVQRNIGGGYGVYANAVLISIHTYQANADAHCQRLRDQQAQE
jgi:hypothetical protein